jgi:hypothetical protein
VNPSALLTRISGKKIAVAPNEVGIQSLTISLQNTDAHIQIDRGTETYEITAGLDDWKLSQTRLHTLAAAPRPTQVLPINVASKYFWTDGDTLQLTSKFVEESIRSEGWILRFEENEAEIKVHIEIQVYVEFMGINSRMLEGKIVN